MGALAWLIILQINVRTLQVQRLSAEYIKLSNQRTDKPNTSHDTSHYPIQLKGGFYLLNYLISTKYSHFNLINNLLSDFQPTDALRG